MLEQETKISKKDRSDLTVRRVIHKDLSLNTFDQDGLYNRQNDCVYAESREAANEDFDLKHVQTFPFKVMV